jgi:sigma-B regulation protein RsbU (phosphoserine phosphatase)
MVVAIENKKLAKEYMRQIATNKELELASKMQNMLFPSELPRNEYLEVDAYYQPHLQVGGDYYDFFKINDNEMVMCMADVSGKGVSAALLMANFQANLRALFRNGSHLQDIISELNTLVSNNAKGEKFITLFLAKYNYITRVLTYINAGHNPPILFSHSSRTWLTTGCIGLGMLSEIPSLKEGIFYLPHGSLVVCFTDGLVEQENPDGKDFGSSLLLETVEALQYQSVRDINMGIMDAVNNFRKNLPFGDDIALLTSRML